MSDITDGDNLAGMRMGFIKDGYTYDAAETPKFDFDGNRKPYSGRGDSSPHTKWARHTDAYAQLHGVPQEDVTEEMLYEEADKQRTALVNLLLEGHDLGYDADELEVDVHKVGVGVYGRDVIVLRNPKTGKIINQELNTPEFNSDYWNNYNVLGRKDNK